MTETELKLRIGPGELAAVRQWLKTLGARGQRLRALYFDTEDSRLASGAMALRLRYERGRWVQTLKAGGASALTRFEHEVVVQRGGPDQPPGLDPALHQAINPGDRLAKRIAELTRAPLQVRFETDIRRASVLKRSRRGTVELSLDVGAIRAPNRHASAEGAAGSPEAGPLETRLVELEIELTQGSPAAVLDVARQILRRHRCWLDPATKAERGHLLATGRTRIEAVRAGSVAIDPKASLRQALSPVLAECRYQLVANLARLADANGDGSEAAPEYVHQARVAIRRLRTACRLFALTEVQPLDAPAGELARALGSARNRDVLLESIAPALIQAGAPTVGLSGNDSAIDPCTLASDHATQNLLLDLIGIELANEAVAAPAVAAVADDHTAADQAGPILAARLARWHRKIRREARTFESLDAQARHRLRRRMKRLRYGTEFCQTLCAGKRQRRFLKALADAQEALGRYNDLVEALEQYRSEVDRNPQSWFAVGWLTSEAEAQARRCTDALSAFSECEAPWKERLLARAGEIAAASQAQTQAPTQAVAEPTSEP